MSNGYGPLIQNFSIPAGNSDAITFDLSQVSGLTSLDGYTIFWNAYAQTVGLPTAGVSAVISKSSLSGGGIEIGSPPTECIMFLDEADTIGLLRNYFHELSIIDPGGNVVTPTQGVMTVGMTENRE